MITERDNLILKHVELYGGITINQCHKIFFTKQSQGLILARKRLRKLYLAGCLKYGQNTASNERVYYIEKKPGGHKMLLMDLYAEFIFQGCKVEEFLTDGYVKYLDGKIQPDGFIKYKDPKGDTYVSLIEIDIFHPADLSRYEALYKTGYFEKLYSKPYYFPRIINVTKNPDRYESNNYTIVYLDYKLKDFKIKVLEN